MSGGSHYGECNSFCPGVDVGFKQTTTSRPTLQTTSQPIIPTGEDTLSQIKKYPLVIYEVNLWVFPIAHHRLNIQLHS